MNKKGHVPSKYKAKQAEPSKYEMKHGSMPASHAKMMPAEHKKAMGKGKKK